VAGSAPAYLDHVRTMGAQDFDISLYKHFTFLKEKDLRFEVSGYNIGNRAQLGMPKVPSLTNVDQQLAANPTPAPVPPTNFGLITATVNTPRQFQFAARFTF
jgi:hypothetical protein